MKNLFKILFVLFLPGVVLAQEARQSGSTSQCMGMFAQDLTVTTSVAGKTGLAYNTATLACSYYKIGVVGATLTSITMAASTLGTYTSGAFKEIGGGMYEFCPPDAALTSTSSTVFICSGISNVWIQPKLVWFTSAVPNVNIVSSSISLGAGHAGQR